MAPPNGESTDPDVKRTSEMEVRPLLIGLKSSSRKKAGQEAPLASRDQIT